MFFNGYIPLSLDVFRSSFAMFLTLSHDEIICLVGGQIYTLTYNNIERNFPEWIHTHIQNHSPSTIYLLNGPGSFTILRSCCLSLNILKKAHHLSFKTINKLDFYTSLYNQGDFSEEVILSIGQKQNFRLYHCVNKTITPIRRDAVKGLDHASIDPCIVHAKDSIYTPRRLEFFRDTQDNLPALKTGTHARTIDLTDSARTSVEQYIPAYMIDPTMG